MFDFDKSAFDALQITDYDTYAPLLSPFLVEGEDIVFSFQAYRDGIVFTDFRLLVIDIHGMTSTKKEFASVAYDQIQAFAMESTGVINPNCALNIWFRGLGKLTFTFASESDLREICRFLGSKTMKR